MSDDLFDDFNENDSGALRQTLTALRDELGDHVAALSAKSDALLGVISEQDTAVVDAANHLADEIGNLEMVIRESPASNRRRHTRVHLDLAAHFEVGGVRSACLIANLSVSGAAIAPRLDLGMGAVFPASIPNVGNLLCTVVSLSESLTHVRFEDADASVHKALGNLLQERLTPLQD